VIAACGSTGMWFTGGLECPDQLQRQCDARRHMQPNVSMLLNYKLDNFSSEKLMVFFTALGAVRSRLILIWHGWLHCRISYVSDCL